MTVEVSKNMAPYLFVRGKVGTTAVSPIVNLPSNEFVGNVALDFLADDVRASFCDTEGSVFSFIVTIILICSFNHQFIIYTFKMRIYIDHIYICIYIYVCIYIKLTGKVPL